MVRENSNLLGMRNFDGELVLGDILDHDALPKLMEGTDFVFHTAGLVSFDNRRRKELMKVNVDGTRNVVNAAILAGVKKVVHTSSVAAIGLPKSGTICRETDEYDRFKYGIAYADSKHYGEVEVKKAVDRGLDAVIVNPASVVGQRDVYFHFGVLLKILKGKKIVPFVPGGMCVVGVDDVVAGEIAALMSGQAGEQYILGGENLSFKELFGKIAMVVGAGIPKVRIPIWGTRLAASVLELLSRLTGESPALTKAHVVSATIPHYFSSEKAKRELGYEPHPVDEAIKKAYEWYVENGLM